MIDIFSNRTNSILAKVLDGTTERQKAIADNIANADTPDYTRKEVSFEDTLANIVQQDSLNKKTEIEAIRMAVVNVQEDSISPRRINGNNVNIEREMVTMAKNNLQFEATAQFLSDRMSGLRNAIKEGKG